MKSKLTILFFFCYFLNESNLSNNISYYGIISRKIMINDLKEFLDINSDSLFSSSSKVDSIINYGKLFLNKPYKFKGASPWPMDCAGYIAFIFSKYGYSIPHSADGIANIVTNVNQNEIQKGDFLFFKGSNSKKNSIGHVSIVIEVLGNNIKMMHSCSRGIVIDDFPKLEYYNRRFIKAGRLPFLKSILPHNTNEFSSNKIDYDDSISIIGVGDIMIGTNYPSNSYLPPNDGKDVLTPIKNIIKQADIGFGNLEGTFLSEGGQVKKCSNPSVCYAFKMPNHYVNYIKEAGFNLLSIANNHIGDFGDVGRENTINQLKNAQINYAGLLKCPYITFEKKGIKYGFCAFAPNEGTVNINDFKNAERIVRHLDSICDIVIVSFHGGAEGASHTHITKKNEMFLGENRGNPYNFARVVIDAGADIVFGHGPHVTRAVDLYKNRFIIYSLGNFATYGRFNIKGVCGLAPIVKLYVNKKGEFKSGEIISTKQLGEGGPKIDSTNAVIKEIIQLTESDIPNGLLNIHSDGKISKK